ncbi:MAG: sporulation protein YqfD [Clostridia bacterium]|nr:sporulation protein YqfD [Clostridia bacterium]
MNLYKPLHYIFGEYVLETSLSTFSRLSLLLTERKLYFWNNRINGDKVILGCSIFQVDNIIETANEAGIGIKIAQKKGLPFIFARYRKRYGLFAGLTAGLLIMFVSQLFVWKITISGNSELSVTEIERALNDCGITVGSFIPNIDVMQDANSILMNCKELSSVAIGINGTHMNVSVLERTKIPDIVDVNGYYNVVASRDGVIIDIDAAEGTPEVKEGDAVFEGELLINSFIEGTNGSFRPTHARGIVYAAVKESFVSKIPLDRITRYYTGKTETKRVFYLLGKELPSLSSNESPYEYFDAVSSERVIKLFGFIELPIKEYRVIYHEYIPQKERIDESEAEILAREELADYLGELDLEALSCETSFDTDKENGICILKADAVLKQNIAKEIPFELISRRKD